MNKKDFDRHISRLKHTKGGDVKCPSGQTQKQGCNEASVTIPCKTSQSPKSLASEAAEKIGTTYIRGNSDCSSDTYNGITSNIQDIITTTLIAPVVKELEEAQKEANNLPKIVEASMEQILCLQHITRALRMLKGEG